ncbi:MAG TPA: hypothetical protein VGQ36_00130 [Thermoanaerobaculia bacterium]|jgi:hypothetical protein|nr:hypothetical protein [Thermoanaerobaculia bacterium]
MTKRRKRVLFALAFRVVVGLLLVGFLARCGSVIQGEYAADGKPFDFADPPCSAVSGEPPPTSVDIRYTGSGGVYIGWGGDALMFGPFFSNPGLLTAAFGKFRSDEERVRRHLHGIPLSKVRAIVTGHSHYDHIGDVPLVARDHIPKAALYTNAAGTNMLSAYPDLRARLHTVQAGRPIAITDANGAEVIRVYPVLSDHAPPVCRCRRWPCEYANGPVTKPWTKPFHEHWARDFGGGETYAYVIDLIRDGEVRYRIYYNDAAAQHPLGIPDAAAIAQRPYDIAILCMASYDFVDGYPDVLLSSIKPRHIIISHYENFFSRSEGHWRFAPLLTNGKANAFFGRLKRIDYQNDPLPAAKKPCGVSTDRWTMPVPDAQVLFGPN